MTRLYKRYIFCAIMVLFVIFVIHNRFYSHYSDNIIVTSDDFIAVAYLVEEDDENNNKQFSHNNNQISDSNQLLNLTNFQYTLQPTDSICSNDILGEQSIAI